MQLFSSSSREYEDRSYTLPQEFLVPDEYETRDGIPTTSSLDADDAHATAGAINDSDDEKRNWFRGITVYKDFFLSAFADVSEIPCEVKRLVCCVVNLRSHTPAVTFTQLVLVRHIAVEKKVSFRAAFQCPLTIEE